MDLRAAAGPGHVRRAFRAKWCAEKDLQYRRSEAADTAIGQRPSPVGGIVFMPD
jgi:hypothetical protein